MAMIFRVLLIIALCVGVAGAAEFDANSDDVFDDAYKFDVDNLVEATTQIAANVRAILKAADYAAIRALLDVEAGTDFNAYDADLTTYAGITPSANVQSLLGAADYAAMRALLDLEAGTDFYSMSAAGAAFEAINSNDFDPDRLAGDDDDNDLVDAQLIEISGATVETTIAADDLILIYDTSATANRAMTRGNFVTGIGAGQAVTFDIGDDGGNDSVDVGEIATTGDTNSIFTEPSADKILIDLTNNWPTADAAVAAASQVITDNAIATVDDADAADNDFAKFTANGLEGRSYAEVRADLGIDSAANLETSLSLGAYASDILGAADSDALVTLLGLVAGDIPDLSATYEAVDADILRADTNDTISAIFTITGNWVNTTNPWADNEVSDTITVGNAGTVDPDAMSGDTTDDDLIDQDVIEGFAGVSDPYMGFRDSDAAGADEADEEAGRIYANLVTATEDAEDSDMWFTIMQGGSRVEVLRFDESDDQWETTKNIVVPTEVYDATDWNGDLTVPTKDAVRDKIEGLAGTGTMTTVEDGDSGVGGADIVTLDFDGTVFNITESPDTEINIDIADDGLDSQHYAGASVDPEHISSGAWDFGTSVEADTITEGGVGVINTGETEVIDSDMYVDASIDPAHIASGAWDFGTSVEADTLTEGGVAVHNNDQMDASSELASIIDDETGSGLIVFNNTPTIATPNLTGETTIGDPGGILLTDDNYVELDATADGMDDDEYNGIVIGGRNCGENLTQWDTVFLNNDADPWHQADADAAGEFPAFGLSVAACTDGNEARILVRGIVRNEGWTGLTPGAAIYLSDTAGGITETAPSTSGDAVQIVGWALSDSEIYFDFSRPYAEVE